MIIRSGLSDFNISLFEDVFLPDLHLYNKIDKYISQDTC